MIKELNNKTMENLASFEQLAVKAILSGKSWNGKFFTYGNKKTFVFIGGQKYQVVNKEAFQEAINKGAGAGFNVQNSNDIRNINKYGFDAIER